MGKVLIVEDLEDMRFTLSNVVKKEKHGVFATATGEEALEIMKGQIIDLVFLDIGLPDINGISLIGKIKWILREGTWAMINALNCFISQTMNFSIKPERYTFSPTKRMVMKAYMETDMVVSISGEMLNELFWKKISSFHH